MLDQPRTDIAVLLPIELRFSSPHPARVLRDYPGVKISNEVKGASLGSVQGQFVGGTPTLQTGDFKGT
ncbi:hypothetical protein GE21DRAFT_1228967 [Neurospora crassa]|nr:hypothetical protein GE21DRAFT_1228967 [Neurospora crassa]